MPDCPAGYPVSGKKKPDYPAMHVVYPASSKENQIRPNPIQDCSTVCSCVCCGSACSAREVLVEIDRVLVQYNDEHVQSMPVICYHLHVDRSYAP